MDRYDLYETCVQNPPLLAAFLRGIHAGRPCVLHEDFCGSAALCREWVREAPADAPARAVGVDLDAEAIRVAADRLQRLPPHLRDHVRFVVGDALQIGPAAAAERRPDIIFIGNFSIGEILARPSLVRYLGGCRSRLAPGGIVVCDTFGGASALRHGALRRVHDAPGSLPPRRVHYTWEQRRSNVFTAAVECALHFRVEVGGDIIAEFTDAFVYRWRVWSVPELRDAMHEAGFAASEVYRDLDGAPEDLTLGDAAARLTADEDREPSEGFIACVVARS